MVKNPCFCQLVDWFYQFEKIVITQKPELKEKIVFS
jgi:hypothetical protein